MTKLRRPKPKQTQSNQSKNTPKGGASDHQPCAKSRDVGEQLEEIDKKIKFLAHQYQSDQSKLDEHDRKKYRLDLWSVGLLGAYTILTAFLLIVGGLQFREGQHQTVAANRAWLYPKDFLIVPMQDIRLFKVTGFTKNVGHEPATKVLFAPADSGFVDIEGTDPRTFPIPNSDLCSGSEDWIEKSRVLPTSPANQSTIFPDQDLSYTRGEYSRAFDDHLSRIKQGREIFYVRDCVAYSTFSEHHTSSFCFYLVRDITDDTLHTYHCPSGNETN